MGKKRNNREINILKYHCSEEDIPYWNQKEKGKEPSIGIKKGQDTIVKK